MCQRLAKSMTHEVAALKASPSFYVWDIAFWNGENLFQYKTAIRFQRLFRLSLVDCTGGEYDLDSPLLRL
jgi:hypothetical protein